MTATSTATLVIATIGGLVLDLLTTGDLLRVQDAAEYFLLAPEREVRMNARCGWRGSGDPTDPSAGSTVAATADPAHT